MAECGLVCPEGVPQVWSRVMPTGRGSVNQKGLDYYRRFIHELLRCSLDEQVGLRVSVDRRIEELQTGYSCPGSS